MASVGPVSYYLSLHSLCTVLLLPPKGVLTALGLTASTGGLRMGSLALVTV